jgi:hypothetical protein
VQMVEDAKAERRRRRRAKRKRLGIAVSPSGSEGEGVSSDPILAPSHSDEAVKDRDEESEDSDDAPLAQRHKMKRSLDNDRILKIDAVENDVPKLARSEQGRKHSVNQVDIDDLIDDSLVEGIKNRLESTMSEKEKTKSARKTAKKNTSKVCVKMHASRSVQELTFILGFRIFL